MRPYSFFLCILLVILFSKPVFGQNHYQDSVSPVELLPDQLFLVHPKPSKSYDLLKILERIGDIEVEGTFKTQFDKSGRADTLHFDLYKPAKRTDHLRPMLIFAHGGAFVSGSRKDMAITHLCTEMAKRGYVCASIDYRLMSFPYLSFVQAGYVALQDAKAAIRYFRYHADRFGIDPDRIFMGGVSAGGITAVHAGFYDPDEDMLNRSTELEEEFGCVDCVGKYQDISSQPSGVISIVGGSPMLHIFDNPIPALHIYCKEDLVVPSDQGTPLLLEQLQEIGGEFVNTLIKLLDIPVIYGPESIKKYADETLTRYLPFEDCNHSLLVFSEGDPKPFSPIILDSISAFLLDNMKPDHADIQFPRDVVHHQEYTIDLPDHTQNFSVDIQNGKILEKGERSFRFRWKEPGAGKIELKRMNHVGIWSDPLVYEASVQTNPDYTTALPSFLKKYWVLVVLVLLTLIIISVQRRKRF